VASYHHFHIIVISPRRAVNYEIIKRQTTEKRTLCLMYLNLYINLIITTFYNENKGGGGEEENPLNFCVLLPRFHGLLIVPVGLTVLLLPLLLPPWPLSGCVRSVRLLCDVEPVAHSPAAHLTRVSVRLSTTRVVRSRHR
jgi:hypothetical protein